MAVRKSGPLDAMVGAKIRMFRINREMSLPLSKLADKFDRIRDVKV